MTRATTNNPARFVRWALAATIAVVSCAASSVSAQALLKEKPKELEGVAIEERLGESLPKGLTFTNHKGERVALDEVFDGSKPAIFAFIYYDCPIVCAVVLDRVQKAINELDFTVGQDFNLLAISFDHTEGAAEADRRRTLDFTGYDRAAEPGVSDGFIYLTGRAGDIKALSDATGFQFKQLANGEYSHPVGIMVLSPNGRVTRYLYGFDYPAREVKLSLLDASDGKIAKSLGDALLHFCYRYDPTAGAYSVEAMAVMRLAGAATVVGLVIFIGGMFLGERVRRAGRARAEGHAYAGGTTR